MKKILSLILVALFVLSCCAAVAEEKPGYIPGTYSATVRAVESICRF